MKFAVAVSRKWFWKQGSVKGRLNRFMVESSMDTVSLRLMQLKSLIIDTQQLRRRLMQNLQELFETVSKWAKEDPEAMKIAGYMAQVLNNLAKSYEERQFNDDLKELERLIQQAKELRGRLEKEGEGVKN
jgi:predicted transcriptional regulator